MEWSKEFEITQGNKKMLYTIYEENEAFQGISIDILDLTKPMEKNVNIDLNPASDVHSISSNFNPYTTTRLIEENGWSLRVPEECYQIDDDIDPYVLNYSFEGKYLGNIVCNTLDCKKIVCFISQKGNRRYYKFLDLSGTDILACTEWDLGFEYLGFCEREKEIQHNEYSKRLNELKFIFKFTTEIDAKNNQESLIDFNNEGISEEGIRKYELFRNTMDLLNIGYDFIKNKYSNTISKIK